MLRWAGLGVLAAVIAPAVAACGNGADVVVTGGVSAERASAYRDLVLEAIPAVEDLWGDGAVPRTVHLDLPSTTAAWAAATGHPPDQRGYAASTVRAEDSRTGATIVIHPDAWDGLNPVGRQAVVTHEVTHLGMGPGRSAPWWLEEGLAEYTAHRRSPMPIVDVAGSALSKAARDPGESWPEPTIDGDAWQGYARAWLACVFIAQRHTEADLLAMFDAASAGLSTSSAVQDVLGESSDDLYRAWIEWLRRQ